MSAEALGFAYVKHRVHNTVEAIILAGGAGTRLQQITASRQKCLLPIDEKPVISHIMESLVSAFGSVDIKIAIAYRSDEVIEHVNANKPRNASVEYVPHMLGTEGWGIYRGMREYITGPFVAMPGDVIALPHAYDRALKMFLEDEADAAITLSPNLGEVDTHGVGTIAHERVTYLEWPPPIVLQQEHLRDMTIWASDPRMFDLIELYPSPYKSIGHVFMKAVNGGRYVAGNRYNDRWIHIGYPEDLKKTMLG